MDGSVMTTTIVGFAAVVGASLPGYLAGRQRSKDRREDWARQDAVAAQAAEVAAQAAEAARLLEDRQNRQAAAAAQTAKLLLAANERVAHQSEAAANETNGRLRQIHELVNSNLTAQMLEGHRSLTQQLVLMREIIRLNEEAGREPDAQALAAMAAIEARVAELGAQLADRAKATVTADAERRTA